MTATAVKPQATPHARTSVRNHASIVSPGQDRRRSRRRERYVLRAGLRKVTNLGRVGKCGYTGVMGDHSGPGLRVTADRRGTVAGLSGLATCGSVWACPVCSARIATARADDLAGVMRHAFRAGCEAAMITLTMRHHQGQALKQCWDALAAAWHAVTSGKQWVADQSGYAVRGWVRVVEVTRGGNGWHVHVHALLIFDTPVTPDRLRDLGGRMWKRWNAALLRKGFDSLENVAADMRKASLTPGSNGLHQYFVKLAHEIAGGQGKLARGGGRTPFQILDDAVSGEKDSLEAWWEWEQASRGRRQIGWSKGLRDWADLGEEQSDEDIAGADLEGDDMLFLEPESWRLMRHYPGDVCGLLEVTEGGGYRMAMRWLRAHGYGYVLLARAERKS